MEHVNTFKTGLALVISILSALWGWMGWFILIWVVLMAIDYATGTAAGIRSGEWCSKIAKAGLWHKGGCIAIVTVACMADVTFQLILNNIVAGELPFAYPSPLGPLVLTWYTLTEIGSIIENAGKMGAPLPPFLLQAINILKSKVSAKSDDSPDN